MKTSLPILAATLAIGTLSAVHAQSALQLSSTSIVDGRIARQHACAMQGGQDQSLQLTVTQVPAEAHFLSIVVDDPDAVAVAGKIWVHWNLLNVTVTGDMAIATGAAPAGDVVRSTGGAKGYEGMCPPNGTHNYRIAAFATRDKLALGGFFGPSAMTIEDFERKYGAQVLAKGMLQGQF